MKNIRKNAVAWALRGIETMRFAAPAIVGALILGAANANAVTSTVPVTITSAQEVVDSLCSIFGWMFVGLIAISTIMGVWAAFIYVTADGDSEKVSRATKGLTYVAVGVAVALLAKALPLVVGSLFGVSSQINSC